jgi:hypothetical protein
VLTIDGKGPTDGGYPTLRTIALIYRERDFSGDIKKFVDFAFMEAAHDAVRKTAGNPSGTSFLSDLLDHLFGDRLEGLARVGLDPLVLVR